MMNAFAFMIIKEGDGVVGVRATAEEAEEFKSFLEITDPDPEAEFTIKGVVR